MSEIKNTFYNLQLLDGRTVKLTLNYARLYALRSKNKAAYDKYVKTKNSLDDKNIDEFDLVYIIYTAYLCANPDASESFEEFLEVVPNDDFIIGQLLVNLIAPSKKKEVFRHHSRKQRQN